MTDVTTHGPASRTPRGLLGMLVVVAAVELSLGHGPTNPLADIWADAYERAGSDEIRRCEVLCLGDSQIKLGVDAGELGRRLGSPAYNLAVHAGQPGAACALLRRALDAGARPSALVVGFYPGVLAFDARTNVRQWPEVLGPVEGLSLAIQSRDPGLAALILFGLASPTIKARDEIRRDLLSAWSGTVDRTVSEIERGRRERAENRGSVIAPRNAGFLDVPGPTAAASGASWRPKRENERAIRDLLALASTREIAVYWLVSPVSPSERARREAMGLDAAYEAFLRRIGVEFPGMVVLSTREIAFDRSVFVDPVHLDGRGAATLTAAVAEAIAGRVATASRWVVLESGATGVDNPRVDRTAMPGPDAPRR